ncbi:bifunctional riboflavin kinase/FAD synthetase [Pendulispora albinea]|uniref:Riboflavin biosynthesis protein n=1 Tax=Pendulispora albinea TaxID=2741071 RepID=A0ABZ2M595_9BACT
MAKGLPYERLDETSLVVGPAESGSKERGVRPSAAAAGAGSMVVIGNLDGVHRGHAAVLEASVERATRNGLAPYVLTFDPHPSVVLGRPEPPRLATLERRAELAKSFGIERVFVRTFDKDFAAWSPERFAEELLVGQLHAHEISIGQNFRFGAGAEGDFAKMVTLGESLGFMTTAHALVGDEHGPFSSSRARVAIAAGDMEEAERILGRPHALSGVVERGRQLGRTLGYPTANLGSVPEMLPPDGVYAVLVDQVFDDSVRSLALGAMSIGIRPTVGEGLARTVEVYLLDFDADLYDTLLRVHVVARLRGEERFPDLEALKVKIAQDVVETRRILATRNF